MISDIDHQFPSSDPSSLEPDVCATCWRPAADHLIPALHYSIIHCVVRFFWLPCLPSGLSNKFSWDWSPVCCILFSYFGYYHTFSLPLITLLVGLGLCMHLYIIIGVSDVVPSTYYVDSTSQHRDIIISYSSLASLFFMLSLSIFMLLRAGCSWSFHTVLIDWLGMEMAKTPKPQAAAISVEKSVVTVVFTGKPLLSLLSCVACLLDNERRILPQLDLMRLCSHEALKVLLCVAAGGFRCHVCLFSWKKRSAIVAKSKDTSIFPDCCILVQNEYMQSKQLLSKLKQVEAVICAALSCLF